MKRYNHDFLFCSDSGTIQKTYRLPRHLEEYISRAASSQRLTKTDVVIEALLHYFSPHIVEKISSDLEQSIAYIGVCAEDNNVKKRLSFEKRRLEMLRDEVHDYFVHSLENLLERLHDASSSISSGGTPFEDG